MKGYFSNGEVQFGFNRLSILDITKSGNQPIISPSGRYVVMCNGEIINYKKLADKIGIKQRQLRSGSDIEVLCHTLDRWGIDKTLEWLRGMYALAIYDKKCKKLKLIRDPAGIKPLYSGRTKQGWVFASQYDQIFKHPWFKKEKHINPEGLAEYLQLGYIPSPNALFLNSWLIEPGHIYTIDIFLDHSIKVYYSIEDEEKITETSSKTLNKLNDKLLSVISDYTISDVPLGSFLSGGIDSPLITSIASKFSPEIDAFTVSSNHSGIDESIQARKIAKYLNINQHIEPFDSKKVSDWVIEHFKAYSEPFSDYSSLPTYAICRLSSKYCKVMLAGDGGDELFWGYPRFLTTMDYKNWFLYPKLFRKLYAAFLRRSFGKRISSGIDNKTIGDWIFQRQGPHYSHIVKEIMPEANFSVTTKTLYTSPNPNSSPITLLKWLRRNEFYGHMQRRLLKVDRASMANSLEVRLPLLDRKLIDFTNIIKPELSITHRIPKYLLKESLKNYIPQSLPLKQKQAFTFNLDTLLRKEIKQDMEESILSGDSFFGNYLDNKIIRKRVSEFNSNKSFNPGLFGHYTLSISFLKFI